MAPSLRCAASRRRELQLRSREAARGEAASPRPAPVRVRWCACGVHGAPCRSAGAPGLGTAPVRVRLCHAPVPRACLCGGRRLDLGGWKWECGIGY